MRKTLVCVFIDVMSAEQLVVGDSLGRQTAQPEHVRRIGVGHFLLAHCDNGLLDSRDFLLVFVLQSVGNRGGKHASRPELADLTKCLKRGFSTHLLNDKPI